MGGEPFDPKVFKRVAAEAAHGESDHIESTDVSRTVDVPEGVWTDVRAGQRTAEGVVTRPEWPGLMFDAQDGSVVCWHLKPSVFVCNRRSIRPEQVVFEEETGAPFCPTCLKQKKKLVRKAKVLGWRKQKKMINKLKAQHAVNAPVFVQPRTTPTTESEIVWREQDENG